MEMNILSKKELEVILGGARIVGDSDMAARAAAAAGVDAVATVLQNAAQQAEEERLRKEITNKMLESIGRESHTGFYRF